MSMVLCHGRERGDDIECWRQDSGDGCVGDGMTNIGKNGTVEPSKFLAKISEATYNAYPGTFPPVYPFAYSWWQYLWS